MYVLLSKSQACSYGAISMPRQLSKHRLNGKIERLSRGVAIYRTFATPYWQARIWDARAGRYVVRSTKETGKLKAREVADEIALGFKDANRAAPSEFSFRSYAGKRIARARQLAESGERNKNYIRTEKLFLDNDDWGLVRHFGHRDVRELKTRDYQLFLDGLAQRRPDLSASTRNMLMATFRNVLKTARDDGVIDDVPDTPRPKQKRQSAAVLLVCSARSQGSRRIQGPTERGGTVGRRRKCREGHTRYGRVV